MKIFKKKLKDDVMILLCISLLVIFYLVASFYNLKDDESFYLNLESKLERMVTIFISLFTVLLVYLAYTQQVKANQILESQIQYQHIENQLDKFENDSIEFNNKVEKLIQNSQLLKNTYIDRDKFYDVLYFLLIFESIYDKALEFSENNKLHTTNKLFLIFSLKYKSKIDDLYLFIRDRQEIRTSSKTEDLIIIKIQKIRGNMKKEDSNFFKTV